MKVFLFAGLIYLAGIAVVLLIKPTAMFRQDGTWKEFGIGRNNNSHTWCPFWLFCVVWALISYIISTIAIRLTVGFDKTRDAQPEQVSRPRRIRRGNDLPEGYYVLSKPVKRGETPSYTYLGPNMEGGEGGEGGDGGEGVL
jgi:hypothetical protein